MGSTSSQSEIEDIPKKSDKIDWIYDDDQNKSDERDQIRGRQVDEQHLKNNIYGIKYENEDDKGEKLYMTRIKHITTEKNRQK